MTDGNERDKIFPILDFLSFGSGNDSRFHFNVGDIVVTTIARGGSQENTLAVIRHRRNAYPPPLFFGYWVPIYFLDHLDESPGGGEIGEDCLRLATPEEAAAQ